MTDPGFSHIDQAGPELEEHVAFGSFCPDKTQQIEKMSAKKGEKVCQQNHSHSLVCNPFTESTAVADPGFPRRGVNPLGLRYKPIIWQDFCQNLHENERNCTEGVCLAPPWIRQCTSCGVSLTFQKKCKRSHVLPLNSSKPLN